MKLSVKEDAKIPLPHHHFDLICGAGMGGIIAIMLGRLHMVFHSSERSLTILKSVDECIDTLTTLVNESFNLEDQNQIPQDEPLFNNTTFEANLKQFLTTKLCNTQSSLFPSQDHARVFVIAEAISSIMDSPLLLCTYNSASEKPTNCHIWEACYATIATPSCLDPLSVTIGGITDTFFASCEHASPVEFALREAKKLWPCATEFSITRIGAGKFAEYSVEEMKDLSTGMRKMVCEREGMLKSNEEREVYGEFESSVNGLLVELETSHQIRYHNFNFVSSQIIGEFDEWKDSKHLITQVSEYLDKEDATQRCIEDLGEVSDLEEPRDSNGNTILMSAAILGNEKVVRTTLEMGANANSIRQPDGSTPLFLASIFNQEPIVHLLLEHGVDVNCSDADGSTPLIAASQNGSEGIVKILLENGANVHVLSQKAKGTALILAARYGHLETVRMLVDNGADVNEVNEGKWSPLHHVAMYGHFEVCRFLLEHGADMELKNQIGCTALHVAGLEGQESIVKLLLENGAQVDPRNLNGCTPLHQTANKGYAAVVKLLLDHGANPDAKMDAGHTSLHLAAGAGFHETVKILLEAGAAVDCRVMGYTAIQLSISKGDFEETIRLLLSYGADANQNFNTNGDVEQKYSLLCIAAVKGLEKTARLLCEYGADVLAKSSEGMRPLDYAKELMVRRVLHEYGA